MIKFEIDGAPQGKGRHRMTAVGGYVRAYSPTKTVEYENAVARAYKAVAKMAKSDDIPLYDKPLKIDITAWYAVPKTFSKAKRTQALRGEIRPQCKPDIDNVVKIVLDGLNNIAYADDKQVAEICAVKEYGEVGKVRVVLEEC